MFAIEAAGVDVLYADKTGTLTRNELAVMAVAAMPGFDEAEILAPASLASSDGGQDSVDAALRAAAATRPFANGPALVTFVPFAHRVAARRRGSIRLRHRSSTG